MATEVGHTSNLARKALIPSLSPVRYFGLDDMLEEIKLSEVAIVNCLASRDIKSGETKIGVAPSVGQKIASGICGESAA